MKKIFIFILSVAIMASVFPAVSFAASPTISVSNALAYAGNDVEVKINLSGNPGVVSMRLSVDYNSDIFTLKEVKDGGLLGTAFHSDNYLANPYTLSWNNGAATKNFTSDGLIVTLKFDVKTSAPAGIYPVTVSYDNKYSDIINVDLQKVDFEAISGNITITDASKHFSDVDASIICGDNEFIYCDECKGWFGMDGKKYDKLPGVPGKLTTNFNGHIIAAAYNSKNQLVWVNLFAEKGYKLPNSTADFVRLKFMFIDSELSAFSPAREYLELHF